MMEFTFNGIVRQGFGFYNPNHAAALICAVLPLLWGWKKYAWAGWITTILLVIPLAMTFSRTGVIVLGIELALYFIFQKQKDWKKILSVVIPVLFIFTTVGIFSRFSIDQAVTNRPDIWLAGLKFYAANPLGVGIGNSGKLVSAFLLDGIECRTLINSHLTLLTECGATTGFLWFTLIFYALQRGIRKVRVWCAFTGLCISASCASIFDWDLLSDFHDFGHLTFLNFVLSWSLFLLFLALAIYLVIGKIDWKQICISVGTAILCVTAPFCFTNSQIPKVKSGIVFTSSDAPLILYDESWNIKSILPYSGSQFQIPLEAGFGKKESKQVFLFGNAAEYAAEFPRSAIIYVYPPDFFEPVGNTEKIILPRYDTREFSIPIERK